MKIDVVISADYINQDLLKGKSVVVIDMLRATSVITTALANGAKEVIPTLTVEEAFEIKNKLGNDVILAGERQAKKVDGFDLSNSPLEFKPKVVFGKTVVLSTTNGTRALTLSSTGDRVFVASVLNAKMVAKKLLEVGKDIVFINAGTNGNFSTDDFICGGYIISEICKGTSCDLTDIAKISKEIYDNNSNIREYVKNATHYEVLKSLELEADIDFCCKKDIFEIVPEFSDGKLK
ncbi:MAG: 2-phosphosulfolactate phosphatase family protein [Sarcina sp.]